eukprot:3728113-Amphidinium_carterae.1
MEGPRLPLEPALVECSSNCGNCSTLIRQAPPSIPFRETNTDNQYHAEQKGKHKVPRALVYTTILEK